MAPVAWGRTRKGRRSPGCVRGRTWSVARDYDAPGIADEFAQTLRAELDYLQEGRNAERFAEDVRQQVRIPVRMCIPHAASTPDRVLLLADGRLTDSDVREAVT